MWLEQLALLYNQALHNTFHAPMKDEDRQKWHSRYTQLKPLLDAEIATVPFRVKWINGYAIVFPDQTTRRLSEREEGK